ncbi:Cell wall-associated hydrolase, NlpC family [Modicisalibacter ilicicola DSM 19980]|uniref:Cell wall-associated hydrolase, NlpC family n=1 Tax=Modicisalibacter ilicicola DSM 19980 TaxID=1121942 RepID=A0A1M4Y825_9GAMM|nr:NlpC/P60 family protein [Halomonas ilicicola]SHF01830.1 Cell wall-associated hydrolase, NlpC family [Halomonas ilicicola DSM 19980]
MRYARWLCLALSAMLAGCANGPSTSPSPQPYTSRLQAEASRASVLPGSSLHSLDRQFSALRQDPFITIRQALLDEYERWRGAPYALGGERKSGIDCSALVQQVFDTRFALVLPRTTHGQVRQGVRIGRDELKAGDLVFFSPPGAYRHVGIYVGEGRFLHASRSRGVMLSRLDNVFWRRYYWQARRPFDNTELARNASRGSEG